MPGAAPERPQPEGPAGGRGLLDASRAIVPLEVPSGVVDRSMGDVHAGGNPHYLSDPLNGLRVARLLAERLSAARPAAAAKFAAGLAAFERALLERLVGAELAGRVPAAELVETIDAGRLTGPVGGWLGQLATARGVLAVQDHRLWPYLARRFGLELVAELEPIPGIAPTTAHLTEVVGLIEARGVRLLLASAYFDPRHARTVADRTGIPVVTLAHQVGALPGADDYLSTAELNVRAVARRSMPAEPLIAAHGLALGYGAEAVVRDVSLAVRGGEFWCWIGPNGCGKSTLLRGLLGLLPPLAGALERSPRLRIGYVPQRGELNGALPTTVRELVALGLVRSGVPRGERAEAVRAALAQVGLTELAERSFWSLSGGQRQRALLARALVRRPELLLLDEPTEGLDVATQQALLATLDALHRSARIALVVVTHRHEIARDHADHVARFADGRVIAGPRAEVLA